MKNLIIVPLIFAGAIFRTLMAGLPNVEPVMLFALVSGIKFGWKTGFATGFGIMMLSDFLIYGFIPYFTILPLGILALVSLSTNLSYGIVGALSAFFRKADSRIQLAGAAVALTLLYDLLTNVSWAFIWKISIFEALFLGLPFMILHVLSNALIVGIGAPVLVQAIELAQARLTVFQRQESPRPLR